MGSWTRSVLIYIYINRKYTFETYDNNLKVFQPGSTVATSIIEAEGLIKQAGLLTISSGNVEFESLKLI